MIETAYLTEKQVLKIIPQEVHETTQGILQILDSEYGSQRNKYEDAGGYVIVVERKEELKEIKDKIYFDCDDVMAEYIDKKVCCNGETYTSSLVVCSND
ncbi:hypothetical protein [Clostridium algidicarnis]|nr:hypothetical protein [Clostridium algidicarnis]MBU3221091.1 hypothetical protein [Clostridium algidicarnis]